MYACMYTYLKVRKITGFSELDVTGYRSFSDFAHRILNWPTRKVTGPSGKPALFSRMEIWKKWRGKDPAGIHEILRMRAKYYPRILSAWVIVRVTTIKCITHHSFNIMNLFIAACECKRIRTHCTLDSRREMRPTDPHAVSITRHICNWNYSLGTIARTLGKNSNFDRASIKIK